MHPVLPAHLPQRVVLVMNVPHPPVGAAMARALSKLGIESRIFFSHRVNTAFDRWIIHPVNHWAHNLRLVPKHVDLFEGHPLSHREYRNREFLRLCREWRPDLVFLTRGLRFTLETLQELRQLTTVFCWYTESEQRFPEIVPELPFYHHTYFFSTLSLEKARDLGHEHTGLLLHAVDTGEFHPLDIPKKYDWCFVGQHHPRREEYLEGLARVSGNFAIYGPRWRRRTWRKPIFWRGIKGWEIWGERLNRLYNQTRVAINVSVWGDEHGQSRGVNMRLLEIPCCRTCLLTDHAGDAELLLTPGEHFESAASLPEMQEKLAALLADDARREKIAQAGYDKAVTIRTYDHLVAEVLWDWARFRGLE